MPKQAVRLSMQEAFNLVLSQVPGITAQEIHAIIEICVLDMVMEYDRSDAIEQILTPYIFSEDQMQALIFAVNEEVVNVFADAFPDLEVYQFETATIAFAGSQLLFTYEV